MDPGDPRLARLKEIVEEKAVLRGAFTLASGQQSSYYFDGRRVTHDAEGIALIGTLVAEALEEAGIAAVGGPASGANPIVTATQIACYQKMRPMRGFYVRAERKEYGAQRRIEGDVPVAGAQVAIVDDVITTGGSIQQAIEAVEAEGSHVARVVVVVDRRQGGAERLRDRGYEVVALFEADGEGRISVAANYPLSHQ